MSRIFLPERRGWAMSLVDLTLAQRRAIVRQFEKAGLTVEVTKVDEV